MYRININIKHLDKDKGLLLTVNLSRCEQKMHKIFIM